MLTGYYIWSSSVEPPRYLVSKSNKCLHRMSSCVSFRHNSLLVDYVTSAPAPAPFFGDFGTAFSWWGH